MQVKNDGYKNVGASKTIQAGHFLSPEVCKGTCGQDQIFFSKANF